jgi:cobalt/nickel transport system permease protein
MHMADALLSPAIGGALWAASAGAIACCSRNVRREMDDRRIPLMGVLGAFVFAAQMINFTIPGTGSSGHLGGGMLLAALLGPHAAFLTIASVLTVQALFFADGGLLALGCNIFNLGFFPCFVAWPLIFRPLAGERPTPGRIVAASLLSAVAGLQLGAFAVVLETVLSGLSSLPFKAFVLLMQPIHLAIGIVEGLVTAAVVTFIWKARPEVLATGRPLGALPLKKVLAALAAAAVVTGGALSWFASARPDGLEWAIAKVTGEEELAAPETGVHSSLAGVQERTSVLPDYGFRKAGAAQPAAAQQAAWPAVDAGTSISGLLGGALTLVLALLIGVLLRRRVRRTPPA